MVLDQYGPRSSAFDLQAMSRMFGFGVFVRGCDEGNDEICKSGEELGQFVSIVLLNKARGNRLFYTVSPLLFCRSRYIHNVPAVEALVGIFGTQAEKVTLTSLTSSARLRGASASACPLIPLAVDMVFV
jgi:hypothetical protein